MPRGSEIPEYPSETLLGNQADTGARSTPADAGAQIGDHMQELGGRISQTGGTLADIGEMLAHMEAQQYVSKTMTDHRNMVDKFMSDPQNYTDPHYSDNLQKMFTDSLPAMQKNAPNLVASQQLQMEFNDFKTSRMESAYKTQTDVTMQKGFNDYAMAPNTMLDSYRTNLKTPNVDAGAELYKQADQLYDKVDSTYGKIAPQMARELKDQITTQTAYGVLNTNPDLAEKLLNRGYIEGRTRHFLEDAIQTARNAQDTEARQTAVEATKSLLTKADMFPDQVQRGFPSEYYQAHGYKPKEANELATKLQYQLDVNKDFGTQRDAITGSNEETLLKNQGDMYQALKSQADPDKFGHDAQVYQRMEKFTNESIQKLHEDPVSYLANSNPELKSATQAYRDNPSPEKFASLSGLLLKYQGPAPEGDTSGKYLNLAMHEMHLLDKTQAETLGQKILNSGPKQAGEILHSTIQQYNPDQQGIVLNDLVNHGKIPIETYAMERTFGAPFSDKLNGAMLNGKALRESVGKQKGSTAEDLDKILDTDTTWSQWSKVTAADNFQRQDVVAGYRNAIQTYAMGMIQDGKKPEEAIKSAVSDLTQWNHETVHVNGRQMQVTKNQYPGTPTEFANAVSASIGQLDINGIKMTDDNHRPIFPVVSMAGHAATAREAMQSIMQSKVFPNLNPDGKSFSLYVRGQDNDFQLRDKQNKPINMEIKDLPTFTYNMTNTTPRGQVFSDAAISQFGTPWTTRNVITTTNWPGVGKQTQDDRDAGR